MSVAGARKMLSALQVTILSLVLILLIFLNLIKIIVKPIWSFLLGARIPLVVRTPDDRFEGLEKLGYNFKPNYLR